VTPTRLICIEKKKSTCYTSYNTLTAHDRSKEGCTLETQQLADRACDLIIKPLCTHWTWLFTQKRSSHHHHQPGKTILLL